MSGCAGCMVGVLCVAGLFFWPCWILAIVVVMVDKQQR